MVRVLCSDETINDSQNRTIVHQFMQHLFSLSPLSLSLSYLTFAFFLLFSIKENQAVYLYAKTSTIFVSNILHENALCVYEMHYKTHHFTHLSDKNVSVVCL